MTLYSIVSFGVWFAVAIAIYSFHHRHEFDERPIWRVVAYGGIGFDEDLKSLLGCFEDDNGDYVCNGPIDFF